MKTTFRPILFSTPMVLAILEGRKTQTRRIVKDEMLQKPPADVDFEFIKATVIPKYKVGDVLWVRETFREIEQDNGNPRIEYKATETINLSDKWKPSIFMPKHACRIFLKIKSIRVERLQDISESDAIAEGVDFIDGLTTKLYYNYLTLDYGCKPIQSFKSLWQKINGTGAWNLNNPFVWVYEFEKIEKPNDFI